MKEIWKDIEGYNKIYQVSNLGRVRSLDRKIFNNGNGAWCNQKGKVLKPNTDSGGYPYVGLYDVNNKRTSSVKVHRLVAFAFCGGYEEGLEVNHINGIRNDNRAENLEWVTRSGNSRHRFKLGYRMPSGERNPASKLKNEHLPIIYTLYDCGVSQKTIAKAFDVSQGTISNIITNKHYKRGITEKGLAIDINDLKEELR